MSEFIAHDPSEGSIDELVQSDIHRFPYVRKFLSVALLAAGLGSIMPAQGKIAPDWTLRREPMSTTMPAPDFYKYAHLPPNNLPECPAIEPGAEELAQLLVSHTTLHESIDSAVHVDRSNGARGAEGMRNPYDQEADRQYQIYKAAADKYGLTVHEMGTYIEPLNADIAASTEHALTLPFETYLQQANDFLALYGVNIEIALPHNVDSNKKLRAPLRSDLQTDGAKFSIVEIMKTFAALPEEYVREINGLRHIVIIAGEASWVGGMRYCHNGSMIESSIISASHELAILSDMN